MNAPSGYIDSAYIFLDLPAYYSSDVISIISGHIPSLALEEAFFLQLGNRGTSSQIQTTNLHRERLVHQPLLPFRHLIKQHFKHCKTKLQSVHTQVTSMCSITVTEARLTRCLFKAERPSFHTSSSSSSLATS